MEKQDYALCVTTGIVAGLAQITVVGVPPDKRRNEEGGLLSAIVRRIFEVLLPRTTIQALERKSKVPFDKISSKELEIEVKGLSPVYHRYLSLGHDPLLGILFGVRDSMNGEISTIGTDGKYTRQKVAKSELTSAGFFRAIGIFYEHLLSDVATPMGLPVPTMTLFNFITFGCIGKEGKSFSEISRLMYYRKYDFRHFVAMLLPVLMIEVTIRRPGLSMVSRNDCNYGVREESSDLERERKRKIRTMLLTTYAVAICVNFVWYAHKKDPVVLNYPLFVALLIHGGSACIEAFSDLMSSAAEERV